MTAETFLSEKLRRFNLTGYVSLLYCWLVDRIRLSTFESGWLVVLFINDDNLCFTINCPFNFATRRRIES